MIIGGLQKFSLLDYPEHLSAIIFTQGCNFQCQFCYNPMLVGPIGKFKDTKPPEKRGKQKGHPYLDSINEDDLFVFLKTRKGKLDAVVITGGEPTLHPDLLEFIRKIKALGYKVKVDTNGTNPGMLKKLIGNKLVDYIAMDIKAAPNNYNAVTGAQADLASIKKSITIIKKGRIPHEFRTTVVPGLHSQHDIEEIGRLIRGAGKWFLQQFKSDIDLVNKKFKGIKPYTDKEIQEMCRTGKKYVRQCEVR